MLTNEMERETLRLLSKNGDWDQLILDFNDIFQTNISIDELQEKMMMKQNESALSQEHLVYLWLLTLKSCTTEKPMHKIWEEMKYPQIDLKREFLRLFLRSLLKVNQLLEGESETLIRQLSDQCIYNTIQAIRFKNYKETFIQLLTAMTYIFTTQDVQLEEFQKFLNLEKFEIIMSSLHEFNSMCVFANIKDERSSGLSLFKEFVASQQSKLTKSSIYNQLFLNRHFDPFYVEPVVVKPIIVINDSDDGF